jgi:formylglycine-generating enzyme required for sulfatase activity
LSAAAALAAEEARSKADAERIAKEAANRAAEEARAKEAKEAAERAAREAAQRARAEEEARAKETAERAARESAERTRAEKAARAREEAERGTREASQRQLANKRFAAAPVPETVSTSPGSKRTSLIVLGVLALLAVVGLVVWLFGRQPGAPVTAAAPAASPPGQQPVADVDENWIPVPGGQFYFGEGGSAESLPTFLIQKHEVTNEEYADFVKNCPVGSACGPAELPSYFKDAPYMRTHARYPVVDVSWNDAQAYARHVGARLPSSKEWEKAARYPDKRRFPWGEDEDPTRANVLGEDRRSEVASAERGIPTWSIDDPRYERDASNLGVLGLAGNVAEWTNSQSEKQAGLIVVAGGSWDSWQFSDAKTFSRIAKPPNSRSSSVGFRCVKEKK